MARGRWDPELGVPWVSCEHLRVRLGCVGSRGRLEKGRELIAGLCAVGVRAKPFVLDCARIKEAMEPRVDGWMDQIDHGVLDLESNLRVLLHISFKRTRPESELCASRRREEATTGDQVVAVILDLDIQLLGDLVIWHETLVLGGNVHLVKAIALPGSVRSTKREGNQKRRRTYLCFVR